MFDGKIGMDARQVARYIIGPVHDRLHMGGMAAAQLSVGTGFVESRFVYLDQIERGGDRRPGPAFGPWQMERATHDDCHKNYISRRPGLSDIVRQFAIGGAGTAEQMQGNLYYAAAMCRIEYYRKPFAMPDPGDYQAMARIWKKYYNTYLGAGKIEESIPWFKTACEIIN